MLLLLDVLCLAGVLWCGALIAGLLGGRTLVATGVAVIVAVVLVLPGFTAGVVTNRRALRGRRPQSWFIRDVWAPPVDLPRWGLIAAGAVLMAFWIAGISALTGISDDPRAGDRASLERQVRHEQRFALGVLGGIGVGGTAMAASTLVRERRTGARRTVRARTAY
ncbi:hypothetical protein BG844_16945 [Couchioplanes caeruleus subsp. caeruleus]|uniref:Uncharacterized protein n=1 Tax=Couchioplanes caeruleus subsp. caeruleus TaxID=56427 RepID=A0A1K0GUR7_9ACTN|nr:hypothetical protein BG844_16945 [Couchioplanes caeruleus subsp. caeruleus]